jgi:hypothetical protein
MHSQRVKKMPEILPKEAEVDRLVSEGNPSGAVKLLVSLIRECVEKKDFLKAEALRGKIFSIDDMALSEIVESAEIIEKAKTVSRDPSFAEVWSNMKDTFSDEEINALYYNIEIRNCSPGDYLCRQGDPGESLYFVIDGEIKSVFTKGREEILIQTMGPGSIAGADSFFSISVATTSLAAVNTAKVGILTDEAIRSIKDTYPAILPKLKSYCLSFDRAYDLLVKKGLNRRHYERFRISGVLRFFVINSEGKVLTNEHRGELSDVSLGGVSFYIKTANRDHAHNLLGRRLLLRFGLPTQKGLLSAERTGIITGVISHMFNDYSVHVKFDKLLDSRVEQLIIR